MNELFFQKRNADGEVTGGMSVIVKDDCVFGRTVQLILALGPYVGHDDMLCFAFPALISSTTMQESLWAWTDWSRLSGSPPPYRIRGIQPITWLESGNFVEGVLDAMRGLMYHLPAPYFKEFVRIPYIRTFRLIRKHPSIFQHNIQDLEHIDVNNDELCVLFAGSLAEWPTMDADLIVTAMQAFHGGNVYKGIAHMKKVVYAKLTDVCG